MSENNELRKAGLKVTLPRVKIMQILESCEPRHMSAEDVYKTLMESGEDVGLATVYRVLPQFEAAGLVIRQIFDGGLFGFATTDRLYYIIITGALIKTLDHKAAAIVNTTPF